MNSPARTADLLTPEATGKDLPPLARNRRIGDILLDAGLIDTKAIDRILAHAQRKGQKFGEAAVQLGLLRREELQRVLAYQFDYPVMAPGSGRVGAEVVAAYEGTDKVAEDLRELRNQVLLKWKALEQRANNALAILSPGRAEGRSFLAANLAVAFSQVGRRTLLIDADFRHPRQHELFGIANQVGLSALLAGRSVAYGVQQFSALRGLSVLPCGGIPPNPLDLFAGDAFPELLAIFSKVYDVVVVDTPAAEAGGEALMIAAQSGGCLLAMRQGQTSYRSVQDFARKAGAAGATLIGSNLGEF